MTKNLKNPELIFAFVGAVGSDIKKAVKTLEEELAQVGYNYVEIRLSDLIGEIAPMLNLRVPPEDCPTEERISTLMESGNGLRKIAQRSDAAAVLAINAIRSYRKDQNLPELGMNSPVNNTAYILNQLKHPDEYETLKEVYGDNFFLISLYSPKEKRLEDLIKKIKKSHKSYKTSEEFEKEAIALIEKDSKEEGVSFGQSVSELFHKADFFLTEQDETSMQSQVQRFVRLLFGYPFSTPTIDEYCMFNASAAALRSADLSRQVGAVISTEGGEVIAAGCNEVPKAGGGAFWEGKDEEKSDYRDFRKGCDANSILKIENITEIFSILKDNDLLSDGFSQMSASEITEKALFNKDNPFLKPAGIANIIEYGRIVHAEMTAITTAARRGLAVGGSVLHSTTFPCHMCARHILAAGIRKVVYIEPYPKSLTKELYGRSVKIDDGKEADDNAVVFEPFVGIAPTIYSQFFQMPKRKQPDGYIKEWVALESSPRLRTTHQTYIESERKVTYDFTLTLDKCIKEIEELYDTATKSTELVT